MLGREGLVFVKAVVAIIGLGRGSLVLLGSDGPRGHEIILFFDSLLLLVIVQFHALIVRGVGKDRVNLICLLGDGLDLRFPDFKVAWLGNAASARGVLAHDSTASHAV